MFELVKFLADQSDKEVKKVIKQLNILKSKQRYQLQCSILNHITDKMYELKTKAETF
jgi:NAD kinase